MALDYSNERWVRLYTRDTATWKLVDWRARTVLLHLLRKVDRAGVLDVGDDGEIGLAAVLELPPEEIVAPGIAQLIKRGVVVNSGTAYALPAFLAAQEAPASDAQRQRDARDKRRAAALAAAAKRDGESRNVTGESRNVTDRHENMGGVTGCHSETRVDDPIREITHTPRAREGQPDPEPATPTPPRTSDPDSPGALVMAAADRLTAERRAIDPAAMPITEANSRDVVARLVESGPEARKRLDHALACVVARAKATQSVDPLRWASFASEAAWAYVQGASVKGYAESADPRARGSPRDGQPRRPPQPEPPRTPVNRL